VPLEPPLLFDLDGTLVDSLPDIAASVNHVRTAHALPALPDHAVRVMVGDGLTRLLERALAERAAGDMAIDMAAAKALYRAHHLEQCTRLVQVFPGVLAQLASYRARGWPMAVVTNKSAVFAQRMLDALRLSPFLPVVVDGESVGAQKPSPEPCLAALRELGAAPGRGTMIGDGVQDLRAGKAAGLRTVAVLYGYRDADSLRAEGADVYWRAFGVPEAAAP
jgi:phosphoglycolate phosphatase